MRGCVRRKGRIESKCVLKKKITGRKCDRRKEKIKKGSVWDEDNRMLMCEK